jgi:hypothetical protein
MPNTITKIWVERVGDSYQVSLMNNCKQKLEIGEPKTLQAALTDAHELGDYFDVTVKPFLDDNFKVVKPEILRITFNNKRVRTRDQLIAQYRLTTGELNWNRLMHYEWTKFHNQNPNGFSQKNDLRNWLFPFQVSGPKNADAASAARDWLKTSTNGAWLLSKGNIYLFSDDRDAALFKMFHHES